MKNNIKNKTTLVLYKQLLKEKLDLKHQQLIFHAEELKSNLSVRSLFRSKSLRNELQELKVLSVVETANLIYKTVTGKKQTPYLVRIARIFIPKILALRI